MNKIFTGKLKMKGEATRRLFSTHKFYDLLEEAGVNLPTRAALISANRYNVSVLAERALAYLSQKEVNKLLDLSAKRQFKDNFLWKLVHKYFKLDLQIPVLFGNWTTKAIKANTVTTLGKQIAANQFGGVTTAPVTAIAIGIGTGGTTALNSESTTNGAARGAATVTNVTTTLTNDTEQYVKTFSLSGTFAFTEEGLFDNNTSGGNMAAYQTFSAVNVVSGDSFQITHKMKFA